MTFSLAEHEAVMTSWVLSQVAHEKAMLPHFHEGCLSSPQTRQAVLDHLINGGVAAFQAITYGAMINATTPEQTHQINLLKGREVADGPPKPIAIIINNPDQLSTIADYSKLHPKLRSIVSDPQELGKRLAGKALVRLPVLPGSFIGDIPVHPGISMYEAKTDTTTVLALYLGDAHPHAQQLIHELYDHPAIGILGVSSMNPTGHGTITTRQGARQFCRENSVPVLITDPTTPDHADRIGSYPILNLGLKGPSVYRHGNLFSLSVLAPWKEEFPLGAWRDTNTAHQPPLNHFSPQPLSTGKKLARAAAAFFLSL